MFRKRVSSYWILFLFLQLIRITHLTFHDSGHGFMTKNSRYFDDELTHIHEEFGSLGYFQNVESLANLNLRFDPEVLDFNDRSLGTPHSKTVTLYNTDSNKSIDLTSISGNTVHFHSSFFEDKQIPPNGNTSFKVVYLGRQEGPVESTLFLHTSHGFVKYNVKAFGTFNSYRVRPIVGVKLPVNSTFTPVIYMHNPHSEPIQIVEIYSSGGGFHLELPSGQQEGPNDLWEINPHETKAVIRVRFEAKVPHNHTAYIRIKLHNPEEILIVPLEVEVTETQNIFHPQGHVDFGIGGSMDEPKEISLCLFNPLQRAVRIHSVSTLSKSIKTQYYNIRINPVGEEGNKCVNVGTLTVDWKNAWRNKDYYGKIIVKFRNGKNRTEIPYFLTVLKGGLSYNKMSTTYFLNDKDMDTSERKFEVLNEFFLPVKVLDVQFPYDMDSTFNVETFTPITVGPLEKKNLFNIWLKSSARKTDMQLTSHIKIVTNISDIDVPLLSYNGKLQFHLPFHSDDDSLRVGLIGHHKTMKLIFALTNSNPVDIPLHQLFTSLPMNELELGGCGLGDHRHILMLTSFENLTKCDKITSNGYAVVQLTIHTSDNSGHIMGEIYVQTPYENLSLPVYYKVAPGEMIIDRDDLIFTNCFPAKICSHPLRIFSTFSQKMSIENILTLPPDKRVSAASLASITSKMNKLVGTMFFNPDIECGSECYTGFVNEGSASWLRTLVITKQVSDYDMKLANTFYNRYLNFTHNGSKSLLNITLRLDTTEVKGEMFVSKVNFTWPSLVRRNGLVNSELEFPLTQVRNSSYKNLYLHNPANHSIVFQLLFENDYPHAEMLYDGLPASFIPASDVKYTSANWFSFDKRVMENQQNYFAEKLRITPYKQSLPFILEPGQIKRITLGFTAEEPRPYSSLLLIRNNLTILEVIRLNGKGTIPRFEFAKLQPGDQKPLHFELTEKHMRACNFDLNQNPYLPNLTIKESFMAKNLGEIPVHVTSFSINGYPCEGYGFKVINCEPFSLSANSSRKIDLAFTPDLTLSEISRVLIIGTSLNTFVNYSLKATVSRSYCRQCNLLLERPPWEFLLSYVVNIFLTLMLLIVFVVAVLDSNSIKNKTLEAYIALNTPSMLPVLDLRKIGQQVREEIQSTTKEKEKDDPNSAPEPQTEVSVKSEPAIVPTTGRAKRKLSQKLNELESNLEDEREKERVRERLRKKDILYERHRLQSRERKTEKELKLLEDKGKKEKHVQQQKEVDLKKSLKKQSKTIVPALEEESSSTTTEGSANCDEVDKENQRIDSSKRKVQISAHSLVETVNTKEAQDHKMKHVSFVNSKLKNKTPKSSNITEHDKEHDAMNDKNGDLKSSFCYGLNTNKDKRRRELKFERKERKDKIIYRHKSFTQHSERKYHNETEPPTEKEVPKNPLGFYLPLPTTNPTCTTWCENKARFSDVVARTEPVSDPSPLSAQSSESPEIYSEEEQSLIKNVSPFKQSKPTSKPTMYVEPYKPIDLGPIGSKRLGTPESNSPDLFNQEGSSHFQSPTRPIQPSEYHSMNEKSIITAVANNSFLPNATNNSFFTQQQSILNEELEACNLNWQRQQQGLVPENQDVFNPLFSSEMEGLLKKVITYLNQSRIHIPDESWRKLQTQTSTTESTNYWSNTFSNVLNSTSRHANNSSYLWGCNSIWEPWSPPNELPIRRSPPGFDDQLQNNEEPNHCQQNNSYSPFRGDGGGSSWIQPWE
ncbi:hypothetical protein ABEB36_006119 [Hypothenemus hampei]|uniref:Transmembrane protein 131 n=1 Tax=Hypothenemus hampei TaxID=57062 RepID=A0ABD1F0J9_HYPHA